MSIYSGSQATQQTTNNHLLKDKSVSEFVQSDKLGFKNKSMCLQKERNGEEVWWKGRMFEFVPNNFFLAKPKLLSAVRLSFILLLETVIQIALSAY